MTTLLDWVAIFDITDKVTALFVDSMTTMRKLASILLGLCLILGGLAHAQDKLEPRLKTNANAKKESGESAVSNNPAPRATLARPPTSGPEPMMKLGPKNKPYTELLHHTLKLDYYDCEGIVAPWFRELLVAEMNYFGELNQMPFINGQTCVVTIGTDKSLTPGRISVQFYGNAQKLSDCVRNEVCLHFRSVNLIEKDNQRIYRSYFLSDISRKTVAQYCVTDKGKLHMDTTCYSVP